MPSFDSVFQGMEPRTNPEIVVDDRRHKSVQTDVLGFAMLPRIVIDGQESVRPDLDPVDIEVLVLVFQTVNLMETVERMEPFPATGKQTPEDKRCPDSHGPLAPARSASPREEWLNG
jgi:hypothetical protein